MPRAPRPCREDDPDPLGTDDDVAGVSTSLVCGRHDAGHLTSEGPVAVYGCCSTEGMRDGGGAEGTPDIYTPAGPGW
jgi:hypothetical protein